MAVAVPYPVHPAVVVVPTQALRAVAAVLIPVHRAAVVVHTRDPQVVATTLIQHLLAVLQAVPIVVPIQHLLVVREVLPTGLPTVAARLFATAALILLPQAAELLPNVAKSPRVAVPVQR